MITAPNGTRYDDFENYLEMVAYNKGAFDGVIKDDMPERFDAWLETQDVNNIMEYAEKWGKELLDKATTV